MTRAQTYTVALAIYHIADACPDLDLAEAFYAEADWLIDVYRGMGGKL